MLDEKDIYCLLFERGGTINFINKKRQPSGSPIIQAVPVKADCSYQIGCPFVYKYHRCPTWEEIQLKYRLEDN